MFISHPYFLKPSVGANNRRFFYIFDFVIHNMYEVIFKYGLQKVSEVPKYVVGNFAERKCTRTACKYR